MAAPGAHDAGPTDAEDFDQGPLPTRIPGQHLSHHPTAGGLPSDADADPMRPYRVHELLTRHAQGKRRGRTDHDGDDAAPDGSAPTAPTAPTPPTAEEDER